MTNSKRQQYGLGSFVKKIARGAKKVLKSPVAKAALLGGGLYGLNRFGIPGTGGAGSGWWKRLLKSGIGQGLKKGLWDDRTFGQRSLIGLGALAVGTPLWQKMMKTGPYVEEEESSPWDIQPASMANLMGEARDYYQNYDPYTSRLAFMPGKEFVNPTFYSATGGLAKLANGGGVAEAQAEQMLKMEYQKYRNQGGTMSYQQFKMQVLKQAQAQGPMAQGQPQMMNTGGRIGFEHGLNYKSVSEGGDTYGWKAHDTFYDKIGKYLTPFWYMDKLLDKKNKPAKKAEGGLMDMGGMEKDYRNEGGFVAIGGKEKADDVPARLSKNEFVFTADAVRNAGGGDIDAGAEVMENVMKNLEAGGEISEESQGAQGMYNNMKQLETRVV